MTSPIVVTLGSSIDLFNKSNIYSFPLLTSLKLKVFNRISKAEYVVNSGKLCILDLLKGSILMRCLGKNGFLHTNKRHSRTIKTIRLPKLAG